MSLQENTCSNCNAGNHSWARYCTRCGTPLAAAAAPQPSDVAQGPSDVAQGKAEEGAQGFSAPQPQAPSVPDAPPEQVAPRLHAVADPPPAPGAAPDQKWQSSPETELPDTELFPAPPPVGSLGPGGASPTLGQAENWGGPGMSATSPQEAFTSPQGALAPGQASPGIRRSRSRLVWAVALSLVAGVAGASAVVLLTKHGARLLGAPAQPQSATPSGGSGHSKGQTTTRRASSASQSTTSTTAARPRTYPGPLPLAISPQAAQSGQIQAVAAAVEAYLGGIQSRSWTTAFDALSPSMQTSMSSPSALASGDGTSVLSHASIAAVAANPDGSQTVTVDFVSHQAPSAAPVPGETCTIWSLQYGLVPASTSPAGYLINSVSPAAGSGHSPCPGQP